MLKFLIGIFMIALTGSLGSSLYFLMTDQGNPEKKRLFTSLSVRLSLATGLVLVIIYGVATGQLGRQNTWDQGTINAQQKHTMGATNYLRKKNEK